MEMEMEMDMDIEDDIGLPAPSRAANGSGNAEINGLGSQLSEVSSESLDVQEINVKRIRRSSGGVAGEENQLLLPADNNTVENRHLLGVSTETGLLQGGNSLSYHTSNGFRVSTEETNTDCILFIHFSLKQLQTSLFLSGKELKFQTLNHLFTMLTPSQMQTTFILVTCFP